MARALRFQAGLPLSLWGACVMTAVHLINRLPSSVLGNKTPYEKLYNTPPTYDHVKTFGCLAFATNYSITADKFAHRGIPAIFMGYPHSLRVIFSSISSPKNSSLLETQLS